MAADFSRCSPCFQRRIGLFASLYAKAVLFGLYGIRPFPSPVPIRNLTPAPLAGRANERLFVASCAVLHST